MISDKLIGRIPYIIGEEGKIKINNTELSVREEAFLCYYLIKNNESKKALYFINRVSKEIKEGECSYDDITLWLWVLGEYINTTNDKDVIDRLMETIQFSMKYIIEEWKNPRANWLGLLEDGIYLSNVAMTHGAIQSINNTIRDGKAQKLILEIQEFLFEKFLDKGKVVSRLGDKEILGDISVIAVPFALMDAGNQILVESINYIENELIDNGARLSTKDTYYGGCVRSDLTCLLSWYYSERGDMARAKRMLQYVDNLWERDGKLYEVDPTTSREDVFYDYYKDKQPHAPESFLSYILYAIASSNIALKEKGEVLTTEEVKILHSEEGTGNKYLREITERFPNYPVKEEQVILKMVTQPFNKLHKAYIQVSANGIVMDKIEMNMQTSSEGEKYWEGSIGHFESDDDVKYSFLVETENNQVASKDYSFTVREWKAIGRITDVSAQDNHVKLYFAPIGKGTQVPCLSIEKHASNTIKWSFSIGDSKSTIDKGNESAWHIQLNDSHVQVDMDKLLIHISNDIKGAILQSYDYHHERFIELLSDNSGKVYKVRYKFLANEDEKYFGMGERYSQIEYSGQNVDNYVYNEYTNQGMRTYIPVPLAISSKGYGLYLDTTMYTVFRFGTKLSNLFEVEVDIHDTKQSLDTFIFLGSPKEVIQSFVQITGKPKLPPKWAFGLWMSSHNWDSQAETLKQIALTKKYEIPATALVLEQWSDEATFYIFNDAQHKVKDGHDYLCYDDFEFPEWGRWPNPKKMVDEIHKEGIKLLLWQAPVQKFMDGIAHAQRDEDERVMLEEGYCIKYKDGTPYRVPSYEWFKRSLIPDFSNPEAKEWWLSKRLYLVKEIGIDGFKSDGGECIYGKDLLFHDGRTGEEMRNQFPNDYIKSFHDFANEYASDGGLTFSRAGYTGAQNTPLHWAGDENSTFEAYRSSLNAGLSCSMSGIPFWGWDLGGFHGAIPTAELFIRSTQMAALCPIMQYHAETKGELNRDRTPWNIAERTGKPYVIDIFKRYVDLRMNLMPYIYQEALYSSHTGIPMMRAMFVEYPNDASCSRLNGQYFFGSNLLVAPVLEEDVYTKEVYLPEGMWMDLLSSKEYTGNRYITVKADIADIPVFVRENSITPMNLTQQYQLCDHVGNRLDGYQELSFLVYVKNNASTGFVDDLGNHIDISVNVEDNYLDINVQGHIQQPITFILRNPADIEGITLDDKVIERAEGLHDLDVNHYAMKDSTLMIKISHQETRCRVTFRNV